VPEVRPARLLFVTYVSPPAAGRLNRAWIARSSPLSTALTLVTLVAIVALVPTAAAEPGQSPAANSAQAAPTLKMRTSSYGRILVDGRGLTLYAFTRDGRGPSRCYGRCATAWPPLLASGDLRAGSGVRPGLLGTTRRRDGQRQVTYRGRPLYFYFRERRPGEIFCQDVDEFGGTWLLMSPRGSLIR
jgi:predicted lipoprotein with Yx(FWY)xxD motif